MPASLRAMLDGSAHDGMDLDWMPAPAQPSQAACLKPVDRASITSSVDGLWKRTQAIGRAILEDEANRRGRLVGLEAEQRKAAGPPPITFYNASKTMVMLDKILKQERELISRIAYTVTGDDGVVVFYDAQDQVLKIRSKPGLVLQAFSMIKTGFDAALHCALPQDQGLDGLKMPHQGP
jgi:hypothetical protein